MKIVTLHLLFLICFNNYAQEYYVNAANGLNVRATPELSAKKTAKLPFGVVVQKMGTTNLELTINENGKQIKGNWVKIKYSNYLYLVSEETEPIEKEGYVFDGFLKNLRNENSISVAEINQLQFEELVKAAPKQANSSKKISNLDSIKTILTGRVDWFTEANESGSKRNDAIKSITTQNGQKLIMNQRSNDYGFSEGMSGYYPDEDILVLEGGHATDVCFSIKTGETDQTIGNPAYIIASPKNTSRLNGSFGGQECFSYFFQIKEGDHYKYLTEFGSDLGICQFKAFYWLNETEFIYINNNGKAYFKGVIKADS